MSSILLRKLTKKSTLKFGKYKDCSVEKLFGMNMQLHLISIYFKLSKITFIDEILDELGITEDFRINKPSKNIDLYNNFMFKKYGVKEKRRDSTESMKLSVKPYSKEFLLSYNHGRR